MSNKDSVAQISSGVEELIQRLRYEGVEEGRAKAEKIVNEAETRAEWAIEQAKEEAERLVTKAKKDAASFEKSAIEALEVAVRDAILDLKIKITNRFTSQVRRLVSDELKKEETLQRLIFEVAGRARPEIDDSERVEMLLPQNVVQFEEYMKHPEQLEKGELTQLIRLINVDELRKGVELKFAEDEQCGIRIHLKDQGITVDLTDDAVADLLLQHLQPRFRALLEGIVR